jgi:periplasmic divalent cation tolerance protein
MKTVQHIVIFVTAKDKVEAQKIAAKLLEAKLIACANILEGVKSMFWWQGKIDEAAETLLVLKTRRALFKKIVAEVKVLHSYETPEVIALPILEGSADYLKWIDTSVAK